MPDAASCSPIQALLRVDDLAEQQLGADRENFTSHAGNLATARGTRQVSWRCQSM